MIVSSEIPEAYLEIEWKTFKRRAEFPRPSLAINRKRCEDRSITEGIDAAKEAGFIPQEIKITWDDEMEGMATSNISIECRSSDDISGKVLCTIEAPGRSSPQWYDLDSKGFE